MVRALWRGYQWRSKLAVKAIARTSWAGVTFFAAAMWRPPPQAGPPYSSVSRAANLRRTRERMSGRPENAGGETENEEDRRTCLQHDRVLSAEHAQRGGVTASARLAVRVVLHLVDGGLDIRVAPVQNRHSIQGAPHGEGNTYLLAGAEQRLQQQQLTEARPARPLRSSTRRWLSRGPAPPTPPSRPRSCAASHRAPWAPQSP